MFTTRGMHCGMTVSAKEIMAVVDREPIESRPALRPDRFPVGPEPHESIATALLRLMPLGGTAVLIDTDNDPNFLGLRTDNGTSVIDPHLLKAQTEVDVRLVTQRQAIAAAVRAGTMTAHDIGPHTFDRTLPFGLVQIIDKDTEARVDVSLIDAKGQPQEPSFDFSCTVPVYASRITDILGHNMGRLLTETPTGIRAWGIGVYVNTLRSELGDPLRRTLSTRFGRSLLYPLRVHVDPNGSLRGALALAQRQDAAV